MTKVERFQDNEIPYELLASFGLSQEMVDDLPQKVLEQLLSGQRTPLLPICNVDENGNCNNSLARLSLVRTEDGIDVIFMSCWKSKLQEEFELQQQQALKNGRALYSSEKNAYYQLDYATQQIVSMPAYVIQHNMRVLGRQLDMEVSDFEQLKEGDVLCLIQGDKPISLGIDLMQDIGIRVVDGDKEQWQREFTGDEFPLYSFGISGCWVNDGHFSYVKEEDYTQDMLDALAEKVNQVKRAAFHR